MGGLVIVLRLFVCGALSLSTLLSPASPAQASEATWVKVVVDLSDQVLRVYEASGSIVALWPVSTGSRATPTPVGVFKVSSKSRSTFAVANPEVSMEYMVRFHGGIGFHSIPRRNGTPLWTPLGVQGVSHGCIRLADAHAKELFERLQIGAIVKVRP